MNWDGIWYYEADLGQTEDGLKRVQRGLVMSGENTEDLFWAVDRIIEPYQVKLTQDIVEITLGWESHTRTELADGYDEVVERRAEVDNDYDGVQLWENAAWFEFRLDGNKRKLFPVEYTSIHNGYS